MQLTHNPAWKELARPEQIECPPVVLGRKAKAILTPPVSVVLGAPHGDRHSHYKRFLETHYCCFGCLAAVALASAIFLFNARTRSFAPLIGIARGSITLD